MKRGCRCLSCRLEEAVLSVLAPTGDDARQFSDHLEEALPAMIPIMGVVLTAVAPRELEPTWRLMLDARCRALDLGADAFGVAGRG
jgi:hypothetical protein